MSASLRHDVHAPNRPCPIVLLRAPERKPGLLVTIPAEPLAALPRQRRRIWELSPTLHCSIIGTCLSAAELRRVLAKAGTAVDGTSDHDLHKLAVGAAGQPNGPARLLTKALDREHRLAIRQFARAAAEEEIRVLWRAARERGEIPGAYWALLTHPAAGQRLIAEAFGDVHMLSHLVGAANRADIRRLAALETAKAELEGKVARQQEQLREAVVSREAKIRQLQDLLAAQSAKDMAAGSAPEDTATALLLADLNRRVGRQGERLQRLERRCETMRGELVRERALRLAAEQERNALREEQAALETGIAGHTADRSGATSASWVDGMTLLYVGGRPGQLAHVHALPELSGATFLTHDGGAEDSLTLLAGLVGRADVVLFPVDCVSHAAVSTVKQVCRLAGKPYVPLRSSGLGSFLAALRRIDSVSVAKAASG